MVVWLRAHQRCTCKHICTEFVFNIPDGSCVRSPFLRLCYTPTSCVHSTFILYRYSNVFSLFLLKFLSFSFCYSMCIPNNSRNIKYIYINAAFSYSNKNVKSVRNNNLYSIAFWQCLFNCLRQIYLIHAFCRTQADLLERFICTSIPHKWNQVHHLVIGF